MPDLAEWNALPVEQQELVIGRSKVSNLELPDDTKPSNSHVALNTITDPDGEERQVLRDNMPFGAVGAVGAGTFGTYYIAYSKAQTSPRRCWTVCSSVPRPATSTGSSTSRLQSPELCSSFPPWTSLRTHPANPTQPRPPRNPYARSAPPTGLLRRPTNRWASGGCAARARNGPSGRRKVGSSLSPSWVVRVDEQPVAAAQSA
jgi:hypothetical protein